MADRGEGAGGGRHTTRPPQRRLDTWERILSADNGAQIGGLLAKIGIPGPPPPGDNSPNLLYELISRISKPPTQEELNLLIPFVTTFLDETEPSAAAADRNRVIGTTVTLIYALEKVHRQAKSKQERETFITRVNTRADELFNAAEPQRQWLAQQAGGRPPGGDGLRNYLLIDEGLEWLKRSFHLGGKAPDWQEFARTLTSPTPERTERVKNAIIKLVLWALVILANCMAIGYLLFGLTPLGVAFGLLIAMAINWFVGWIAWSLAARAVRQFLPFLSKDEWYKRVVTEMRLAMIELGIKNTSQINQLDLYLPVTRATDAGLVRERLAYWLLRYLINDFVINTAKANPDLNVDNTKAWGQLRRSRQWG